MRAAGDRALPGPDLDEGLLCLDGLLVDGRSLDSTQCPGVIGLEAWLEELVIWVQRHERNLCPLGCHPIPGRDASAREPLCHQSLLNLVEKNSPGGWVQALSQLAIGEAGAVDPASPDILHIRDGAATGVGVQQEVPHLGECLVVLRLGSHRLPFP